MSMKWVMGIQIPKGNRIKYLTSEMEIPSYMEYYKYLEFVQTNCNIKNFNDFKEHIDSFQTVLVLKNGDWEVQPEIVDKKAHTFTELFEYNEKTKEKKQAETHGLIEGVDLVAQADRLLKNKKFKGHNKVIGKREISSNFKKLFFR